MKIVRVRLISLFSVFMLLAMHKQKTVKSLSQQTEKFKKSLADYESSIRKTFGLSKKQMSVLMNESNIKEELVKDKGKLIDLDKFITSNKERKLNDLKIETKEQADTPQAASDNKQQVTVSPQQAQRKLTLKDYLPIKRTLILQPSEITFLSKMVKPTETLSLEDRVKAVKEGAAQCTSKKQRKLYFEMINSVFESSITKNVIGGILALTAARVYNSNFHSYNHRIRNLKANIDGANSVFLMRRQQKHGYVKSILNVIDDLEKQSDDFETSTKHKIYMLNALIEKNFGDNDMDGMLIEHDTK